MKQTVVLVLLVLFILAIILFETDRRQGRDSTPPDLYYGRGSFLLSPYNLWAKRHSKFPVKPFYLNVREIFPGSQLIQSNWQKIRNEALAIIKAGKNKPINKDQFFTSIAPDGWTRFYLKWYSKTIDPLAKQLAPFTSTLIEKFPEVKLAMFSILGPKSSISRHRGPFRGALRYHLGLDCPKQDGCQIEVDGQPYRWKDGEDVLFDDTFMHSVENNTDDTRIIFFCDVARPMKTQSADRFNNWICDSLGPVTSRNNDQQEKVKKI